MAKEITKTVLQIENLEATDLVNRLNSLENTLQDFVQNYQQPDEFLTRAEIAKMLKITLVTVSDWTKKGTIQAYKIGGRVLYKKHEILNTITPNI